MHECLNVEQPNSFVLNDVATATDACREGLKQIASHTPNAPRHATMVVLFLAQNVLAERHRIAPECQYPSHHTRLEKHQCSQ